MTWGVVRGEVW